LLLVKTQTANITIGRHYVLYHKNSAVAKTP